MLGIVYTLLLVLNFIVYINTVNVSSCFSSRDLNLGVRKVSKTELTDGK